MFDNITNEQIRGAFVSLKQYTDRLTAKKSYFLLFLIIAQLGLTLWRNATFNYVSANTNAKLSAYMQSTSKINDLQQESLAMLDTRFNNLSEEVSRLEVSTTRLPEADATNKQVESAKIECVPEEQVTYLRYILNDQLPIPDNTFVEFTSVCNGDIAIKWTEWLNVGVVEHYFVFEGVDVNFIYFKEPGRNSYNDTRAPQSGDSGILNGYADYYAGEDFGEDQVVDNVYVIQLREWTPTEVGLITLNNQMYEEAVRDGWFYFWYAADRQPDELLMNGYPVQHGPYGFTYKVPASGGTFAALYKAGNGTATDYIRWSYEVKPGDIVSGTETVSVHSMKESDPWNFCGRLVWMRPVWQPKNLDYSLDEVCSDLWGQDDDGILATLAREGFQRADSRFGDDHPVDYVPFIYAGGPRKIESPMPIAEWKSVESTIVLSEKDIYEVSYDSTENMPIFAYAGSEETSAFHSDIPWFETWGDPIVFVPRTDRLNDTSFDWTQTKVYRIRHQGDQIIVEQAIWTSESN